MLRVPSLQLEASADLSGRTLGSASNGDRRDIHCLVCLTHWRPSRYWVGWASANSSCLQPGAKKRSWRIIRN